MVLFVSSSERGNRRKFLYCKLRFIQIYYGLLASYLSEKDVASKFSD
jgi:hypothetical protein